MDEQLEAWAFNVMLECMGREEEKIEMLVGGAILDLRDLDRILTKAIARTNSPVVEIGEEIPDLTDEQFAAIESLAQRQAREVMNPKSGQATATTTGQAFNKTVEGILDRYPNTMAYLASKENIAGGDDGVRD